MEIISTQSLKNAAFLGKNQHSGFESLDTHQRLLFIHVKVFTSSECSRFCLCIQHYSYTKTDVCIMVWGGGRVLLLSYMFCCFFHGKFESFSSRKDRHNRVALPNLITRLKSVEIRHVLAKTLSPHPLLCCRGHLTCK